MSTSILDYISKDDLKDFLKRCKRYTKINSKRMYEITLNLIRKHDGKPYDEELCQSFIDLEDRWYESLKTRPDYSVYNHALYFSELWVCWIRYSRKYLKTIQTEKSLFGKSIVHDMKRCKSVLDLGCGCGFTTQALREIFPKAKVTGTNLSGTPQFTMASVKGLAKDFTIQEELKRADLIFASEYFEHIESPLEHLREVLETCQPKYLLIANAFGAKAIGHFNAYTCQAGSKLKPSEVSKLFNKLLRYEGYVKVETACWNNRPAYWKRVKKQRRSLFDD